MSNSLEERLLIKSRNRKIPLKTTLELSPLCNMNCRMCYINESKSKRELDIKTEDYWIQVISELKNMGTLFVTLIGGEPFMYPGIENIYSELINNGFLVSITTNGTLLADGLPGWLLEKKPNYMTVSVYGASDETYRKVTGNPKGFTQVKKAISHLKKAEIPLIINCCVIPENLDDLEEILRFAKDNGCRINASHYTYPNNARREKAQFDRLSPEQAARAFWKIHEIISPEKYRELLQLEAGGMYVKSIHAASCKMNCNAGQSQLWISWKGHMSGCGIIEGKDILAEPGKLEEAWKQVVSEYEQIQISQECASCRKREACGTCAAMMFTETGSFTKTPGYRCRIMEQREIIAGMIMKNG